MSDFLGVVEVWFLVALIVGPLIGKHLKRIGREYKMADDVRHGLDEHYKKSGRPGMAAHDAMGRDFKAQGRVLKNA